MNNLIVNKPNQLIEIAGNPISVQGLIVYNFLLLKFQQEKKDKLIISMNEIFSSLDISDNYNELYDYLNSLQKIRVESRDKKGKLWGAFNLLSEFKKKDNGIFIQIPNSIFKALCGGDEENKNLYYTTIKLLEERSFKCSYSFIFYELFKKYEKVNIPFFTLEELKELTGTETKYKVYYEFKRFVLNKALKEINIINNEYEYSFEEKKLGKKVNEIKFIKNLKNNNINLLKNEISEKLEKEILKARKNRFIDSAYSYKSMLKLIDMYEEVNIISALKELTKYNKEIINFSKIMISKIEDVKNSKKSLEVSLIPIISKKVLGETDLALLEPKKELSIFDVAKEELVKKIMKLDLKMNKRIELNIALENIESFEGLTNFMKKHNIS